MMEPLLDPEERELEQSLLNAGRDIHMSRRLQAQTLTALGLGAVGLTAAASAQASSVVWFKGKVGVLLLSIGGTMGALGTGYFLAEGANEPGLSAPGQAQSNATEQAAHLPEPLLEATPTGTLDSNREVASANVEADEAASLVKSERAPQERTAKVDTTQAAKPTTTLADELDHITRATTAINRGQPQVALAILSDYQKRFPRPQLGLEVEVLRIEALAKSGNQAEAQSRANRFVARYPNSALVARVKRILR